MANKIYNWLTQNSKMKKSSGVKTYNWGIPAILTCPTAGACKKGCFGNSGAYLFSNVKSVLHKRLDLSRTIITFIKTINSEIKRRNIKKLRIHDVGDFYGKYIFALPYVLKWFIIMYLNPTVQFYAYTKRVILFKYVLKLITPNNIIIIYSYGGTQDKYINPNTDRHSKVFELLDDLIIDGYTNASDDDNLACSNSKVGLVYHGTKNWSNTTWDLV